MRIDRENLFSDAQALTASAASTDCVDLGLEGRQIFQGEPMAIGITVDVAADATTGDETYQFELEMDTADSFGSATDVITRSISRTSLTLGSFHSLAIPFEVTLERYLRMYYTLGGTTPTITVTSWLAPLSMLQKYKAYADGFTLTT